jgi:hypothetical protein
MEQPDYEARFYWTAAQPGFHLPAVPEYLERRDVMVMKNKNSPACRSQFGAGREVLGYGG